MVIQYLQVKIGWHLLLVGCRCRAWGVAEQGDLCSEGRLQRLSLDNSRSILRDREAAFQFGSLVCFQIRVEGGEDFAGSGLFFIQVAMPLTQFPNCVIYAPWLPGAHIVTCFEQELHNILPLVANSAG